MDPFLIASIVATLAGSAIQYKASSDAQKRQQAEIQRSLENQERLQREAEQKALTKAAEFDPADRKQQQAEIADQITTELIKPVSESQAIRAEQQGTVGNVSSDYDAAKTRADLNTMKNAENLARLLGKTSSASRLRMNEGIGLMDTGQEIDMLANFSRGQQAADNIAIQQAGQVSPGMSAVGGALQGIGTAGLMSSGGNPFTDAKSPFSDAFRAVKPAPVDVAFPKNVVRFG